MTTKIMSPILFDTHAYVKKLIAVGFTELQAETLAEEQASMIENKLATKQDFERFQLATKQDIEQLQKATKQDIEQLQKATKQDIEQLQKTTKQDINILEQKIDTLESNVKRDMHELEMRMTIKLGAMLVVGFSIFATVIKLF